MVKPKVFIRLVLLLMGRLLNAQISAAYWQETLLSLTLSCRILSHQNGLLVSISYHVSVNQV